MVNFKAKIMLTPLLVFAWEEAPPMFHHVDAAKLELELHLHLDPRVEVHHHQLLQAEVVEAFHRALQCRLQLRQRAPRSGWQFS